MRAMPRWEIQEVASAGTPAANEPLAAFLPRREVVVTRIGPYTRVVLTKRERQPAPLAAPRRA